MGYALIGVRIHSFIQCEPEDAHRPPATARRQCHCQRARRAPCTAGTSAGHASAMRRQALIWPVDISRTVSRQRPRPHTFATLFFAAVGPPNALFLLSLSRSLSLSLSFSLFPPLSRSVSLAVLFGLHIDCRFVQMTAGKKRYEKSYHIVVSNWRHRYEGKCTYTSFSLGRYICSLLLCQFFLFRLKITTDLRIAADRSVVLVIFYFVLKYFFHVVTDFLFMAATTKTHFL
jgi:hypothetical protein